MNIRGNLRNYWLLPIVLLVQSIKCYIIDLSKIKHTESDIWTFLCDFPVLSSGSEELIVPKYYYSLDKGGRMTGYVKIASVEELDDSLVVPDEQPRKVSEAEEVNLKTEINTRLNRKLYPAFAIRWRRPYLNKQRSHHSFLYLVKTLFDKDEKKEIKEPQVQEDEEVLHNLYLVLFTHKQWQLYLLNGPYDNVQPSRNKRGFIYYTNVISKFRVPITKVGDVVHFEYVSEQPERYILLLFNPDQRKMKLEGYVKYENPKFHHLPVEMNYHYEILWFWWSVNMASFFISIVYLFLVSKTENKVINYLLSFNFLLYTAFLLLDLTVVFLVRETGLASQLLWSMSHIFKRLHEIYMLTIMVLLSLGWKILRDRLSTVEFQLISSICCICILMGFVEVLVSGFDISRYLVHAIACICIVIAANFNIVLITTRIADEELTPEAGIAYNHMNIFSNFRLVFFIYMFKPAFFSVLRFICLQPTFDRLIIWDQHLNLFIDLTFDFAIHFFLFLNFLPRSKKGLFNHIFQIQAGSNES